MALKKTTVALISVFVTFGATVIPAYWKYHSDQQTIERLGKQPGRAVTTQGKYEWQWAGDRWKGYVTVDMDGAAHIDMIQYADCPGGRRRLPLLEQHGNGKVTLADDPTKIHVSIPVKFITYDNKCNKTGYEPVPKLMEGYLNQKIAYAGAISYMSGDEAGWPGDMVLIKDFASGEH